ncbi:MAG: hypothetical protein IJP30_00405 [Clostridia bacterium]|nr:hypothetical protein [Clostridia bacterium]
MRSKWLCIVFAGLLFSLAILGLATPDRLFSENENRYLTALPALSFDALIDGTFMENMEQYLTDQFPLRDGWVKLKTKLALFSGQRDSGGIYIGKDGYLIEVFRENELGNFEKNLGYIAAFAKKMEAMGHPVSFMPVPTASQILRDKLWQYVPEIDQAALIERAKAAGLAVVDVMPALSAHKNEYIYYRTDHHWTSLGAYYAYQVLLGGEAKPLAAFEEQILSRSFLGTTHSKVGLYTEMDTITAYLGPEQVQATYNQTETRSSLYERSYLETKDKYSVFLNANQSLSVIDTGIKNGKKLMLIKDSYANCFVQFLTGHYEQIHVIDLRYFKTDPAEYAKQQGLTQTLVLYNLKGFAQAAELYRLGQ